MYTEDVLVKSSLSSHAGHALGLMSSAATAPALEPSFRLGIYEVLNLRRVCVSSSGRKLP